MNPHGSNRHHQDGPSAAPAPSIALSRSACFLRDGKEVPVARHSLQWLHTAIIERESGAGDEILDRARNQHLARVSPSRHAGADVHGDAAVFVSHHFALARMKSGAHVDAELVHCLRDGARTANPACRTIEGGEEPIARGINLAATIVIQLATHGLMMAFEPPADTDA